MNISKLGKFIKARRETLGLSLRDIERKKICSNSYLCLLEQGKRKFPKLEILKGLGKILDVPLIHLLTEAGCFDEKGEKNGFT